MQLQRHYHTNWNHYIKTPLSKLELSVWLHTFGDSLVSIFIPILLLQIGFSLDKVILFYLILHLIDIPLNIVARNGVIKVGARAIIFIGIIFRISMFAILFFADFNTWIFIILAILFASYDTFYWVAHWFVFNECVKTKGSEGKKVGGLDIIRKLASLISPAIGAMLLLFLDKKYLLGIAIIFLFLSLIPLLKLKLRYVLPEKKMTFKEFFSYKKNRRDFLYTFLSHFNSSVEGIILPLFVYITFKNIASIGALPIIATIASMVFVFYVGKWSDKFDYNFLILVGSLSIGLFWILRIMFPNISIIYLTSLLIGFFGVLVMIPIDSNLVKNGKETSMIDISCYRNLFHMLGGFVLFAILYLFIEFFHISFGIAAGSMFLISIISGIILRKEKKNKIAPTTEISNKIYQKT